MRIQSLSVNTADASERNNKIIRLGWRRSIAVDDKSTEREGMGERTLWTSGTILQPIAEFLDVLLLDGDVELVASQHFGKFDFLRQQCDFQIFGVHATVGLHDFNFSFFTFLSTKSNQNHFLYFLWSQNLAKMSECYDAVEPSNR